jgi:hypothetical protein
MVFNATFNNISVILWRSVLLVEETGESGGFNKKKIVSGSVFRYANYTFCHGITPRLQKCSYL